MVFITKSIWKNNGIEVIIVNNVNLGHSNLSMLTLKYPNYLKKKDVN